VPEAFHDAAGALIGNRLFVFGGGATTSSASVQAFDLRTHRSAVVGDLPRPLSDLVAARSGKAVYLVGGYDGNVPRPEIYRTYDGIHIKLVARLPVGLRYPAVAAANGDLFIAGGVSAGGPTSAVYRFDPRTGRVSIIGRLPVATAHAVAVPVGSGIDVLGGSPAVSVRIDPRKQRVERTHLQLDDANGAAVSGRPAYLLGGDVSGRIVGKVWKIQATHRRGT
jgi:N-acetylneuraminic acid mutarotase